jgi:hypothetical protein
VTGPGGELPQQCHAGGGERHEPAVDHDGLASHVDVVAGDRQRDPAAERDLLDDLPDQRAKPGAARLDHRDAFPLERARGDRPHAGGHDGAAQRRAQAARRSLLASGAQEARRRRCARERDRVDRGIAHRLDQAVQRRGVFRQDPAVDGHLDHLGAG